MTLIGRQPKILIVEYLSNHGSDVAQILNLNSCDQTKAEKNIKRRWPLMEDDLNWKTTSKHLKWNISVTTVHILLKF